MFESQRLLTIKVTAQNDTQKIPDTDGLWRYGIYACNMLGAGFDHYGRRTCIGELIPTDCFSKKFQRVPGIMRDGTTGVSYEVIKDKMYQACMICRIRK